MVQKKFMHHDSTWALNGHIRADGLREKTTLVKYLSQVRKLLKLKKLKKIAWNVWISTILVRSRMSTLQASQTSMHDCKKNSNLRNYQFLEETQSGNSNCRSRQFTWEVFKRMSRLFSRFFTMRGFYWTLDGSNRTSSLSKNRLLKRVKNFRLTDKWQLKNFNAYITKRTQFDILASWQLPCFTGLQK